MCAHYTPTARRNLHLPAQTAFRRAYPLFFEMRKELDSPDGALDDAAQSYANPNDGKKSWEIVVSRLTNTVAQMKTSCHHNVMYVRSITPSYMYAYNNLSIIRPNPKHNTDE